MLLLLIFQELCFDHFNFFTFLLDLDTFVVFLLSRHVSVQEGQVVCVATKNTFVVHDVQCFALELVLIVNAEATGLLA